MLLMRFRVFGCNRLRLFVAQGPALGPIRGLPSLGVAIRSTSMPTAQTHGLLPSALRGGRSLGERADGASQRRSILWSQLAACVLGAFFALLGTPAQAAATGLVAELEVQPPRLELRGIDREHRLIVSRLGADGGRKDVTREVAFSSSAPQVVTVDDAGHCRAVGDGEAEVRVTWGDRATTVRVAVTNSAKSVPPSFRQDILPILTRNGCNAGGCHGKLAGQNGFRLSLRGFAPDWDYDWLARELGSRRFNFAFPEKSLVVSKPTGGVPHEGGTRFRADSRTARTLIDWIAARAPGPQTGEADADRLEVLPGSRELRRGEKQQLLVRAHYPDGRVRDVGWLAQFFSNDDNVASVKPDGLVTARGPGRTSVRVHFQSLVEAVGFTVPYEAEVGAGDFQARNNAVDEPVFALLRQLRLPPSPGCDDATFLRRAFLDTVGVLPTPEEAAAFRADRQPDKRARWVDDLLARPEWADYWALQFADLLQNRRERDHDVRGIKGVRSFHAWLREQLVANRGWDAIARDILLAQGEVKERPQIGYFVTLVGEYHRVEESELPDSIAQAFLGTRLGCARCHNHPLERYTQDDFYHLSAYFSKIRLKREKPETGDTSLTTASRDEEDRERTIQRAASRLTEASAFAAAVGEEAGADAARQAVRELEGQIENARKEMASIAARPPRVTQPRTGKSLPPQALDRVAWSGGAEADRDPRGAWVAWMLKSDLFSGAMVNRLWKHFLGVGLVEPVDDLRASNPPSNPELWELLNREFVGHGFDLKHVMRLILNSRTYQLGSETLASNATDTRFYSHYFARRLPAEVLLDAVSTATGSPVAFAGYPLGMRAVQLPEPGVGSYFLTLFGRSDRVTACACERKGEVTLPQLLHVRNSDDLLKQIASTNGLLQSVLSEPDTRKAVDTLFLAALNRPSRDDERIAVETALTADSREAVFKDLFWALLNSKEFAFNH